MGARSHSILMVVGLCLSASAVPVDLSGTVVNAFGKPVSNAIVSLNGLADTTGADGLFALSGTISAILARDVSARPALMGTTLLVTVPTRMSVEVSVFDCAGRLLEQRSNTLRTAGLHQVNLALSKSHGDGISLIRVRVGGAEYLFKNTTVSGAEHLSAVRFSSTNHVEALAQSAAAVDSIRIEKAGYQSIGSAITSYEEGDIGSVALDIVPYGLNTVSEQLSGSVPRYAATTTLARAAGSVEQGPDMDLDTTTTWALFRDGIGQGAPSLLSEILGVRGLPFYAKIIDYMINKVNLAVSSTGEVIDTNLVLADADPTLVAAYNVEKSLNFDSSDMDMVAMLTELGNVPEPGSTIAMEEMRLAFALTDTFQYIVCRAMTNTETPGFSQRLNVLMYGKRDLRDSTLTISCDQLADVHESQMPAGMFMRMRTHVESVSIPDSGFVYKWAQFKPDYSGYKPSALTSIISVGKLGEAFGIRRVVTAFDTAASVARNVRSDQFFETDTTWTSISEGVNDFNGPNEDAYLTYPWVVLTPKSDMFGIGVLPTTPKTVP